MTANVRKEIVIPALVLFIICVVMTGMLAVTNQMTFELIAEQDRLEAQSARQVVLADAMTFEEGTGPDGAVYYLAYNGGGQLCGYVFITESRGYDGPVRVMTGVDAKGAVAGVTILSHSETPGLGSNAANARFLDQYKGPLPAGGFVVRTAGASNPGEVEAVTGATITSSAVTRAVNQALDTYQQVKEGP